MNQEHNQEMRLARIVEENRVTLRNLRTQLNTLKLMLELQGLKVDAPERKLEPQGGSPLDPAPAAS